MSRGTPRVAVCCDLAPETGTTHLVRCLALAEELASRGVEIVFVCDADSVPWAQPQITARGMTVVAPVATAGQHVDLLERVAADAVVFDSRLLPRAVFAAVRRTGRPTLAIVDGEVVEIEADILVAPSMGAEAGRLRAPQEASVLAGLDYALLRNDVLANRPIASPQHDTVEVP
ncbi:MAG: spore coat protein, partial [Nocardioidaceae bacterium]